MIQIWKKLRVLLDKKQKHTMAGLVVLMIIGAFLQTAGVGLLVQVVSVVVDPKAVEKSGLVRAFYDFLGCRDFESFSVTVMVLLVVVFGAKNLFLYVQQKLTFAFVYTNQFRTSERMLRNYLRRGYEFYLNADTAVVQRSITSDVNNMYALILSLLQLMSDGVMSLFVVGYCLASNGIMTVLLAFSLLLLMAIIKRILKPIMYKSGKDNQDYYSSLFKWISQTVQGIKEVKITCREQYFVEEYRKCGKGYVDAVQRYSLYNNIPKLLIETVCIAVMMGYMIVMTLTGTSAENMLEMLSTLGAAAFVLLPAVNRINNQINSIAYFEPFFMGVRDNLQEEIEDHKVDMSFASQEEEKLPMKRAIELRDIVYAYPNSDKLIFDHATLTIPIGSSVGIVGVTGAGKSTIVDIMLGLLEVREGMVCADGVEVKSDYRRFLKNIGYIPQMLFMLDDTIRRNVAFGVRDDKIDEDRIWEVLREAQLDSFVKSLPDGLETTVGERGIRLSGGQRQRISIARVFLKNPPVIILDEATSALDNESEYAVARSLDELAKGRTTLTIAHRLSSIRNSDRIMVLTEEGIVEEGNHDRLMAQKGIYYHFYQMANEWK